MNFKNIVLLEQVRLLEQSEPLSEPLSSIVAAATPPGDKQTFEAKLLQRAKSIVRQGKLQPLLQQPARLYRRVIIATSVLLAILGILAVTRALSVNNSDHYAINIYWLLLVLLGFNLLSMVLWIVGILTRIGGLVSGTIGQLPLTILQNITANTAPAARAWFKTYYQGTVGLWRVSALGHQLWLIYLLTGFATLVVLLAAQQYDFYWGSTLLSIDSFTFWTELFNRPLAALGLPTINTALFDASRAGISGVGNIGNAVGSADAAQIRQQWAMFLIAAVVVYGIVPRAVCWLMARLMLLRAEHQFTLDYYLPYYVHLRQVLMPTVATTPTTNRPADKPISNNGDPTDLQPLTSTANVTINSDINTASNWPSSGLLIGVELYPPIDQSVAININNKASFEQALELLKQQKKGAVAILADSQNIPDRGIQRQINAVLAERKTADRWLLLVNHNNSPEQLNNNQQRLTDWYSCAKLAGIDPAQVQRVDTQQLADLKDISTAAQGQSNNED